MSIKNRQLVAALGLVSAAAGILGTAGLSFDGTFDPRRVLYTVPFAVAAVIAVLRAPRMSAAMLFGTACGAFAIEAWTASVNRQGCIAFMEFGPAFDAAPTSCSPIGLALLLVAAIASIAAATLLMASTRIARTFVFVLAGIVLAPMLLYLLTIGTLALGA
jgi:hypothetical protein